MNKWTSEEDRVLREQISLSASKNATARDWTTIAASLPGRSNKDCRKRWANHLVKGLRKGPWSSDEDNRLSGAVEIHGNQWSVVAEEVGTRSADQCSKRWQQALDPELNRSKWTTQEEQTLIEAVAKHGRAWKTIQTTHFPERSTNNVKNCKGYATIRRRLGGSPGNSAGKRDSFDDSADISDEHFMEPSAMGDMNTFEQNPLSNEINFDFMTSQYPDTHNLVGSHLLNPHSTTAGAVCDMSDMSGLDLQPETAGRSSQGESGDMVPEYSHIPGPYGFADNVSPDDLVENNFVPNDKQVCVWTVQDPSPDVIMGVMGALVQTGASFRMERK